MQELTVSPNNNGDENFLQYEYEKEEKHKRSSLVAVIVVLIIVIVPLAGFLGYLIGRQQIGSIETVPSATPTPIAEIANEREDLPGEEAFDSVRYDLSDILDNFCQENTIDLQDIPLTFSNAVQNKYSMNEGLFCSSEENYVRVETRTNDGRFPVDVLYVFDDTSVWMGPANPMLPPESYISLNLNGRNAYLEITEPGPFGISDLGLSTQLMIEKKNPSSTTTVRFVTFKILQNNEITALIRQYGKESGFQDEQAPEYILIPENIDLFKQEVKDLALREGTETHLEITEMLNRIEEDYVGVSF